MFHHAYDGYLTYAIKFDELRPLTCDGIDTWGSYSLTLIDALDTLAVMGNYTEFVRVTNLLTEKINFDSDINVSVFETNIRIVGGLLSAHLLSHRAGVELEPGWPCNGPLLRMAEDVAKRLLPAFAEAHPLDPAALRCCYDMPRQSMLAGYNTTKFLGDVFQIVRYEEDERKSEQEFRKNIVAEIMKVMKENKYNREHGIKSDINSPTLGVDDSIILPIDREINEKNHNIPDDEVKTSNESSTSNRSNDSTESETDFVTYDEENVRNIDDVKNLNSSQLKSFFNQEKMTEDHVANNSVLSEFVQSVLKSTLPMKPKFNPQSLLEKMREIGVYQNVTQNWSLLTCKAQSYLNRVTVLGEFY